jgi:hypothetical protein
MADWLLFEPSNTILRVTIVVERLNTLLPSTMEDTDVFCQDLYPILDKIQAICVDRNLKQVCTANLEGFSTTELKPVAMMRVIWNVYEHTKNNVLIERCEAVGGGEFFNTLVSAVKGFLPPFMRGIIQILPSHESTWVSPD